MKECKLDIKQRENRRTVVILGGGAAGFFGAVACAQANPNLSVHLFEKSRQLLTKVKISGGGRCNVTHACYDPALLVKHYPRGNLALRGPFSRFQPKDTIQWFEKRGVQLKTESDGRMFPVTDSSETIVDCLMKEARVSHVRIKTECSIVDVEHSQDKFQLTTALGEQIEADDLLVCTGSAPKAFEWLTKLGHTIIPPVPSLFTFNVPDSPLLELSGVSVPHVIAKIEEASLIQEGPLLMTHWGFSGPVILKLSAWGARILHDLKYQATLMINWLPMIHQDQCVHLLNETKQLFPSKAVVNVSPFNLPKQLWKKILTMAGLSSELKWAAVSKKHLNALAEQLQKSRFKINGKSTFKEEFVTCGGIKLDEVNFKTMESRICPRLFFAGEVLDIDGVTGGFNFQNAWTTSWIAAQSISDPKE